ncbi:MAG: hypothetical protein IK144_00980 [Bacteroidaceae bacterium]|nr:hypothetical protein [Bacteroidaceae bacterium]
MKKVLFYLLLLVGFFIIFGFDIYIIVLYDLDLLYAIPLGFVFVITLFRLYRIFIKSIMYSNSNSQILSTNKNEISECSLLHKTNCKYRRVHILILILSYISSIIFLCLSIYVLKQDNPRRVKYLKLEKEFKYESQANFYIRPSKLLRDTVHIEPEGSLGNSFGTFLYAIKGKERDNYHYKNYPYGWIDIPYNYIENLSIYKIGISGIKDVDSISKQCKNIIENYLDSLDLKYEKIKKNSYRILYSPYNGYKTLKTIIIDNGHIYELTSNWNYKVISKLIYAQNNIDYGMCNLHDSLYKNIITTRMGEYISKVNNRIIACILLFLISFSIYIFDCSRFYKLTGNKIKHNKMWIYVIFLTVINLFVIGAQFSSIYFNKINSDKFTLSYLYLFASSLLIMNMPMLAIISIKMRNHNYDYMLLGSIRNYLTNRTQSITEYKSIISLEVYPFFILGNFPLGILLLPLWIPYIIIQISLLELRRWVNWLYADEHFENENKKSNKRNVNTAIIALFLFIIFIVITLIMGWAYDFLSHLNLLELQKKVYSVDGLGWIK